MASSVELAANGGSVEVEDAGDKGIKAFASAWADRRSSKETVPTTPAKVLPTTLDTSNWPVVHGTKASLDSTDLPMPVTGGSKLGLYTSQKIDNRAFDMAQMLVSNMLGAAGGSKTLAAIASQAADLMAFNLADSNPVSVITERVSETEQYLWTSTIGNIICFKHTHGQSTLELVDSYDRGYNFRFHGSYALVGKTGTSNGFFTTLDDNLVRYSLRDVKGGKKQIYETGRVQLPKALNLDGTDHLVGATLLEDGTIVVGSKHGVLMAARVDDRGGLVKMDTMALGDFTKTTNAEVSNSISSAGQEVYVVTQREQVRADFDPVASKFVFKWTTVYGPEEPWFVGRLGPGSGSTPTVTKCKGKDLIVITDGALPMNVLWYDAADGALVGSRKVQFTPDESGNLPTTSEQSVAVSGCKAFVVQNFMGKKTLDDDVKCMVSPGGGEVRSRLNRFCESLKQENSTDLFATRSCPPIFGCTSFGAATYEIDTTQALPNGQFKVQRVWTRTDVSCGTAIPLISNHKSSPAVYCVGIKGNSSQWSMLGMDLATGVDVLDYKFYADNKARNFFANPFYAGVEAVGPNEMVIGSLGGVLYVSPDDRSAVKVFSDEVNDAVLSWRSGQSSEIGWRAATAIAAAVIAVVALMLLSLRRSVRALSPRLPS